MTTHTSTAAQTAEQMRANLRDAAKELRDATEEARERFEKESKKAAENLSKQGRQMRDWAEKRLEEARLSERFEKGTMTMLHWFGLPHMRDVEELGERVEELTATVDRLRRDLRGEPAAPAAAATAAEPVIFHVQSAGDDWEVRRQGADAADSTHGTKKQALAAARDLVHEHEPCELVIHRKDGKVMTSHSYGDEG